MEKYVYLVRADNDAEWPEDWLLWNVCVTLTREQAEREVAKRYPLAVRSRKPPAAYHRIASFDKADDPVLVDVFEDPFVNRGLDRAVRIFVERWTVKVEESSSREHETLKPCPFCGGEAEIERYTTKPYVACSECGCSMPDRHQSETEAIAAWNTRYEKTCKVNIGKTVTGKGQTYVAICDSCGRLIGQCCDYGPPAIPKYCPNCSARVIKVVDEIAITREHAERIDQAIAARNTSHVETCRNQWQWNSGFCCSECFYTVPFVGKFADSPFTYCPNCCAKVVDK